MLVSMAAGLRDGADFDVALVVQELGVLLQESLAGFVTVLEQIVDMAEIGLPVTVGVDGDYVGEERDAVVGVGVYMMKETGIKYALYRGYEMLEAYLEEEFGRERYIAASVKRPTYIHHNVFHSHIDGIYTYKLNETRRM